MLPNDLHDIYKLKISTGAHWTFLADERAGGAAALDIQEYTDVHHAATVPHTLVLAPGLGSRRSTSATGSGAVRPPYQLWEDLRDLFRRIKPDFDPTTPRLRAAWEATAAVA